MYTIYFDSTASDDERRKRLYEGQLFVFSPHPASLALCEFARDMVQDAFGGIDPTVAQFEMPTEQFVSILAKLKPQFVHHRESMRLVQDLLRQVGCDLDKTYIDVPRLKSVPHGDEHRSGLTFAIHAHRDTWYSAPQCQLNWWLPIYELEASSALAFHPRYWSEPVPNGSSRFNHYRWNTQGRKMAATNLDQYVQEQPKPEVPIELDSEVRPITRAGGIMLFAGAQLHAAVPNTSGRTRFSIDFRTVHLDDVTTRGGAPNLDSAATGTTLRDFLRGSDLSRLPDEMIALYDDESVADGGELVFQSAKELPR